MSRVSTLWYRLLLMLMVTSGLAACRTAAPASTETPAAPPSATPLPATTAAPPTATTPAEASATLAPEATATPAEAAASASAVVGDTPTSPPPAASATPGALGTNLAEFVADVTVPDGSDFTPGEAFVKTWQLRNAGTATWTSDYALVFVRGAQMGSPASVPLPGSVPPGQTVDISVDLVAPTALGDHIGFWLLRTAAGQLFGLGAEANQPVYVQIDVVAAPGATAPPAGTPGAVTVTAATLSVDQAAVTGTCPQTFEFTGSYTSQGAGTVTYRLEAAADTPGFVFDLPATSTAIFTDAGPRTVAVSYSLEFTGSVGGQVWLHILTPNDLESNRVGFSLTCQP
jgi:hypothetical protein